MTKKLLLIGPLPGPIHGMSRANKMLLNFLKDNTSVLVKSFNTEMTNSIKAKDEQGKGGFLGLLMGFLNSLKAIYLTINFHPDVVYITPGQSSLGFLRFLPLVLCSRVMRIPVIQHIHGSKLLHYYQSSGWLFKKLIEFDVRNTDKFIVLSSSIAADFERLIPKEKIYVCENGVEIPSLCDLSVNDDNVSVLFLSNLMRDKGILDLFNMIDKFQENSELDKFKFDFAGEVEKGLELQVSEFFRRNANNCKYHGVVSGLQKDLILRSSDVLILPSYDEGVPLAILEAYANQCAVVTTPVGGIPDILDNEINGFFCNVGDCDSIFSALKKTSNNIDFIKINNRVVAESRFSNDIFGKRILEIISL